MGLWITSLSERGSPSVVTVYPPETGIYLAFYKALAP
jgi:hypothetical protein